MTNSEMKEIEITIARKFLELYNPRFNSAFEIFQTGESPDIHCVDKKSGEHLYLEITIHENLMGDIRKVFNWQKGEEVTLGNSLGIRGSFDNILKNLSILLGKKLQASYGNLPTALVIGRVITIWSCHEWIYFAKEFAQEVLQGKKQNYKKGIWIFCANDGGTGDDILNLLEI